MKFGFDSVGHMFATFFHDIHTGAQAVEKFLATKVIPLESEVEAVTSVIFPPAVMIERAAFGLLGLAAAAAHDAQPAADANGLNITLDAQMVADIRALLAASKDELVALGLYKVTPPPAPVAVPAK
jgi:hypothetical protein